MSAAEAGRRLAEHAGGTVEESFELVTVDVPAPTWVPSLTWARDELHLGFFDWLSAVDAEAGGFLVVCHLVDPDSHDHLLVRTAITREQPVLGSATGVFRGASWHERETFEMFGITFDGHPHLVPLLLPEGFEGYPLRKDFVLVARAARPWPGAKEPGESAASASRRRMLPPGVPDSSWGPRPPEEHRS